MRIRISRGSFLVLTGIVMMALLLVTAIGVSQEDLIELVEGTAVLLNQSSSSGGGATSSTSTATNIFSPAAYADYKRFGGEPTVAVDRYPFEPGRFGFGASAREFRDITYVSAPQGFVFPRYSTFYKSDDLAQSFRVPQHLPIFGRALVQGSGGGDSHIVIGQKTHKVYFLDLPFNCVTLNVSKDLGESWRPDEFACNLSFLDDRQWVEADETLPGTDEACLEAETCGNVYVSFINLIELALPTLAVSRSTHGAAVGSFLTDSPCNPATFSVGAMPPNAAPDDLPTPCPDPADPFIWVAGPVVADKEGTATRPATHQVYIPFIRRISLGGLGINITDWQLYVAKSVDGGGTWTRHKAASIGSNANPANIFPQLAIDRGGNLYYTWSQTHRAESDPDRGGEQDVFYTFSTDGGMSWAAPINLTKERGGSAIFPWMVAGDPGRVNVVYYKATTGINSNIGLFDPATGNACEEDLFGNVDPSCVFNPSVWNVFFGQAMNALSTAPNFKNVQVSAQPNHVGQICTGGLSCDGDRDLLDFFTVDVDHLGAALIAYSEDNQRRSSDTRDRVTRQISGNSLFKDQNINLLSSWPVRAHAVTDREGDVFDGAGFAKGSCPGMDILSASVTRSEDLLTVTMTLNSTPTAAKAIGCATAGATGGIWGAEFWAAADLSGTISPANNFYVAYRDNPPEGPPAVEAGAVDNLNLTITSLEFRPTDPGTPTTPGGTCFSNPVASPCTLEMSVKLSDLDIKAGAGLFSVTGLSAYFFGTIERPPLLRIEGGNSEQADATAPIHYTGTGTTQ